MTCYTSKREVLAVQAILTLSMSAHAIGLSEDSSVHLGTALHIAKIHELHHEDHAPLDDIDVHSTISQRHGVLVRELKRGFWSQLCVQGLLSESPCISLADFNSTKPSNRIVTRELLADSFPSPVSFRDYMHEIAVVFAEHHSAVSRSNLTSRKLDYFGAIRTTCVEAAITILRKFSGEYTQRGPILWLDILHTSADIEAYRTYSKLIEDCIEVLRADMTVIAVRGVKVLSALMEERKLMRYPLGSRKRSHNDVTGDHSQKTRLKQLSRNIRNLASDTDEDQTQAARSSRSQNDPPDGSHVADKKSVELFPAVFSNRFLFGYLLNFDD